jgi:MoxR-like ATPase
MEHYRSLVRSIPVAESVITAAVKLIRASRPSDATCPETIKNLLTWGAGPRASQYIILAAKAYAILDNRPTPDIGDVRRAAYPELRHRLIRSFHAEVDNISQNRIIDLLIEAVIRD